MTKDIAIRALDLGKCYNKSLGAPQHDSIREAIQHGVGAMLGRGAPARKDNTFWALQDASFEIARGENVGIIGLNGAGKSTLLKVLSRIVTPTVGSARIVGRLGALLEVGTGFHQELTGRENTFLYGAILGMSRKEVSDKFDAIVDFGEIGEFIDMPVKRYSSGMYVRLAFSVASHLDPDILLLDEVLSVGDFTFQTKCINFAQQLKEKSATILFVSHNMHSIRSMCQRVIYLKRGRIVFDGPTDEGLALYEKENYLAPAAWWSEKETPPIKVTDISLLDVDGKPKSVFDFGERMKVRLHYETLKPVANPHFLLQFIRSDNVECCTFSTSTDGVEMPTLEGPGTIELTTPPLKLVSDSYNVSIVMRQDNFARMLFAQDGPRFQVRHALLAPFVFGVFHEAGEWKVEA
jgi:homopolymeric O-antigen transport system ATP-binding protein